mgnify:CR=1 FL=1
MALDKESTDLLNSTYKSYKNFNDFIIDIFRVNKFNSRKIFSIILIVAISVIFSTIIAYKYSFNDIFSKFSNINITICIGLFGTLIASFSIALSGLNRDSLYCLILSVDKRNSGNSFFKNIILICFEPLVWFFILLCLTLGIEIVRLIYPQELLPMCFNYFIKVIVFSTLFSTIIFSLSSLKTFLMNFCNLLFMCSKFEILFRTSKSSGCEIDQLIDILENQYNDKKNKVS